MHQTSIKITTITEITRHPLPSRRVQVAQVAQVVQAVKAVQDCKIVEPFPSSEILDQVYQACTRKLALPPETKLGVSCPPPLEKKLGAEPSLQDWRPVFGHLSALVCRLLLLRLLLLLLLLHYHHSCFSTITTTTTTTTAATAYCCWKYYHHVYYFCYLYRFLSRKTGPRVPVGMFAAMLSSSCCCFPCSSGHAVHEGIQSGALLQVLEAGICCRGNHAE